MSTNNDPNGNDGKSRSNRQNRQSAKFAIVAGAIAIGILAATLTTDQLLNAATAQTTATGDDNGTKSMPSYHGYYG
jgi:hypothetical protein